MRCSSLFRLLVLFLFAFLAGSILGFTVPQRPLSQPSNDPATKLYALQISLAARMSEHVKVMATQLQAMDSAFEELALIVKYSLHFHFLATQLESYPMRALLRGFGDFLDLAQDDMEAQAQKSLEIIKQNLALMAMELDDIEAFMLDIEGKVGILSDEILKSFQGRAKGDKTSVNGRKVEVDIVTAVITNNPLNVEQKAILAGKFSPNSPPKRLRPTL